MDLGSESADPADEDAQPTNEPIVLQPGDLFVLGKHRLTVGDAREPDVYERLMAGELVEMGFYDPPFNLKIFSLVGRGKTKHREFFVGSGELSSAQFVGRG